MNLLKHLEFICWRPSYTIFGMLTTTKSESNLMPGNCCKIRIKQRQAVAYHMLGARLHSLWCKRNQQTPLVLWCSRAGQQLYSASHSSSCWVTELGGQENKSILVQQIKGNLCSQAANVLHKGHSLCQLHCANSVRSQWLCLSNLKAGSCKDLWSTTESCGSRDYQPP